ncbi:MAG: cytochrome c [Candidatus Dactylopiibacterium sp.]|nr:cytochrome c [Candidatus Dactylopiibacterium sp.]
MKFTHLAALMLAALTTATALAQAKPEDQIKYRQSAMVVGARSVAALNAMAKGDVPFNPEQAQAHANVLANLTRVDAALAAYGPGTDKGAPTKAAPKIWSEPAQFKAAFDRFATASQALPAAAGSVATLKGALADLGKTCKGCHDDYRQR